MDNKNALPKIEESIKFFEQFNQSTSFGASAIPTTDFTTQDDMPLTRLLAARVNIDPPLSKFEKNYLLSNPMSEWQICQEFKWARQSGLKTEQQPKWEGLIENLANKMDALRIDTTPIGSHDIFAQYASVEKEKNFFQKVKEKSSNLFLSSSVAKPNEKIEIHLTPLELDDYPTLLIDTIEQFLILTESKEYENLLQGAIDTEYEAFTLLTKEKAYHNFKVFDSKTVNEKFPLEKISRVQLNNEFRKVVDRKLKELPIVRRKFLNQEFRVMMRNVIYTLLLTLRKEQMITEKWCNENPLKQLDSKPKSWIDKHKEQLQEYLKRVDSEHPKVIPIEYPVKISYTVRTIQTYIPAITEEPLQQKVDDITRWIDRVNRCSIDPLGNIKMNKEQINETQKLFIFFSNKDFIDWLRRDPSVSFIYVRKNDSQANKALEKEQKIFTITMKDIKKLDDNYLNHLSKLILQIDRDSDRQQFIPKA